MNFKPNQNYDAFTLGDGEYFEYRVGDGGWEKFTNTKSGVTFGGAGNDLQLRGISSKGTAASFNWGWTTISFENTNTTYVRCSGDIRTLVNYKDYENAITSNARFCSLFKDCLQLTSAPDLPATELADYCYYYMFCNCVSLQTAPKLPAMILAEGCYHLMFMYCSSLTTAPKLPAMTLADYCYNGMFGCCSSLTTAPALPAMTLANYCYAAMFADCTSLQTVELPATTLAESCYEQMFYNCSALQTVYIKAKPSSQDDIWYFLEWLEGAGSNNPKIYCYEAFYNFVKGAASEFDLKLCPDYWSFYDIDNTWSQWGQY